MTSTNLSSGYFYELHGDLVKMYESKDFDKFKRLYDIYSFQIEHYKTIYPNIISKIVTLNKLVNDTG